MTDSNAEAAESDGRRPFGPTGADAKPDLRVPLPSDEALVIRLRLGPCRALRGAPPIPAVTVGCPLWPQWPLCWPTAVAPCGFRYLRALRSRTAL